LLGCRCNSATKQHLASAFQVRRNDSAKIVTRFFLCVAALKLAARLRAKNKFRAVLLRFTSQQKIHKFFEFQKLQTELFGF
jgi:hypothetical protein